jgi:hypothetical protein
MKNLMSNQELLNWLIGGPFAHFHKVGSDDWRDPHEQNPALSLSQKGWKNHRTGASGGLLELAMQHGFEPGPAVKRGGRNFVQKIWDGSELPKPGALARERIKGYLSGHRGIPESSYLDLLELGLIRWGRYRDDSMLVYPSLTLETITPAFKGQQIEVNRIQRIFVSQANSKICKKHLGSETAPTCGLALPPLKGDRASGALVLEGLEDSLSLRAKFPSQAIFVGTDKAGLKNLAGFLTRFSQVLIIADHDEDLSFEQTGQAHALRLAESLTKSGVPEVLCKMPLTPKEDANAALLSNRLSLWFESLVDVSDTLRIAQADPDLEERMKERLCPKLKALSLRELLEMQVPEQKYLLYPIIRQQGLLMIYAARGCGKTWVALEIACAVASGGSWLSWYSPEPAGVLYIDGEMPLAVLQERLARITANLQREPQAPVYFLTPDVQEFGLPDLSTPEGQKLVEEFITEDIKLIVLDNLSTLVRTGKESEGESWLPLQQWALSLRKRVKSVLFIHHANKSGGQRGSSRREDVLDTVIALKRPADYAPEDGAVIEIHFEKARGLLGKETSPIEARLISEGSRFEWIWKPLEQSTLEKVVQLLRERIPVRVVSEDLGISQAMVYKHRKRAITEGMLSENSTTQPT